MYVRIQYLDRSVAYQFRYQSMPRMQFVIYEYFVSICLLLDGQRISNPRPTGRIPRQGEIKRPHEGTVDIRISTEKKYHPVL